MRSTPKREIVRTVIKSRIQPTSFSLPIIQTQGELPDPVLQNIVDNMTCQQLRETKISNPMLSKYINANITSCDLHNFLYLLNYWLEVFNK